MFVKFAFSFLLMFLSLSTSAQFIHPGCLHTQVDIDRINTQLAAGDHPRITKAWNSFNNNWLLAHTGNWLDAISGDAIIRGGIGENFAHSERDFGMCYIKALYWAIKHNSTNAAERFKAELYAKQTISLLGRYTKKIKTIGGDPNYALAGCFQGWQVANAGELLRDYPGWAADDQFRFKKWIYDVWYPAIQGFLWGLENTCPSLIHSNWSSGNASSLQAIGIYLDDPFIYNEAMYYLKQSVQNNAIADKMIGSGYGYLIHQYDTEKINAQLAAKGIKTRYESPMGYLYQNQESNRDQPHCQIAIGVQLQMLEQAWSQGDNAYGWNNYAVAGGIEYSAGFNSAEDNDSVFLKNYPNLPWNGCADYQPSISYSGRGTNDPVYQMGINHYANRMGLKMPYSKKSHQKLCDSWSGGVEWGAGENTRFGFSDVSGFGDLMYNQDSTITHPTLLRGKIRMVFGSSLSIKIGSYKEVVEYTKGLSPGDSIFTNELSNISRGSVLRLCPTIMDGSADTGLWTWDDDASCTTGVREIKLSKSRILRARYTNASGAVSVQMFSLQVDGEGWVGDCKPYYISDFTTFMDSSVYVKKFAGVTLGINYKQMTSVRNWKWERKSLTGTVWNVLTNAGPSLDLTNVSVGSFYRVTMTNLAGVSVVQNFKVEVAEVDPFIAIGKNAAVSATSMSVLMGSNVKLFATPNSLLGKSVDAKRIFKWVIGNDTLRIDTLTNHLDAGGLKVADLTDTLSIASLDSCMELTLEYVRISALGTVAATTCRFNIQAYQINDLVPAADDYYYIIDPFTGKYLSNSTGIYTDFDTTRIDSYQWRFRKLASTYGNRYYIMSKVSPSIHLGDDGKLNTTLNYSKYSFNFLHKFSDEHLYGIQQSATSSSKALTIDRALNENVVSSLDPFLSGFPFRIISVTRTFVDTATALILPAKDAIDPIFVHVYDLAGHRIRKNVKFSEALVGLKRGFYIVGRKKVVLR